MTDSRHDPLTLARDDLRRAIRALGLHERPEPIPVAMPPESLVTSVNSQAKRDPDVFLASGMDDLAAMLVAARMAGWHPPAAPAVLDFGCGAGRLLRHMRSWAGHVAAADRQGSLVDWLAEHMPGVDVAHVSPRPGRLPWASGSFDLIVANSVFTHVPLDWQAGWLEELRRLLGPTGALVVTVLGQTHRQALLDEPQRVTLDAAGSLELWPECPGPAGELVAYGAVFEREDVCLERLGHVLPVRTRLARDGRQDVVVMMAPAG